MHAKVKRYILASVVAVSFVAVGLYAEHLVRCSGAPLTREQALRQAATRLQTFTKSFDTGNAVPSLVGEQFDNSVGTWIFTYSSPICTISVLVNKCEGADVGGSTGCAPR
jgi:hypothetical protein